MRTVYVELEDTMMVDGKPILNTLDAMYSSQRIEDFMRNGYDYCVEHETEIREHIRQSERKAL